MKEPLYAACMAYVQQRIQTATEAMVAAQESANAESKSSAGDKYETGRAMAQLERDRHAQLLADAQHMRQELEHIDPAAPPGPVVRPGSLVQTSAGNFYIAISAGRLQLNGQSYMAVSPASPIGALLRGKSVGDTVTFNRQVYIIESIL
ncbi:3-oxoacyl-ACP synthase [Fibrella aquatilis]|uniref:3-oxoacyl-ACP synthase n=1 Tax=Fibrella aquatilis TaxID=2817059 RepID=A0A939G9W9_9BACT|nr:3-oxoacyl-ACP synthase [Fibrella aquatilis]MBO0934501.1 3-oxoacyl-ACP synthase [Fibrella aquatilis]